MSDCCYCHCRYERLLLLSLSLSIGTTVVIVIVEINDYCYSAILSTISRLTLERRYSAFLLSMCTALLKLFSSIVVDVYRSTQVIQQYRCRCVQLYSSYSAVSLSMCTISVELLTHYQTTNFRLFQTERVCRRQFQI